MYVTLIAVAALWGAAAGLLVPRAAYRLSVEPEEPWRTACPAGHAFTGPARGWLGPARCPVCVAAAAVPVAAAPRTGDPADLATPADPVTPANPANPATLGDPADPGGPGELRDPAGPAGPADRAALPGRLLVPALLALSCAVLAAATGPRPELAAWLLLAPFAVLLALVDRRVHRLPDQVTLPLAAAAAVLLGLAALLPGGAGSWPAALLGGLVLGAAYLVLFLIHPNGMGFGDVKLALSLGVALGWYGWAVLFAGAFAGFVLGSLYGIGLLVLGRANRKTGIPFGPFMIVGALAGLLLGALAGRA
ncbi:prepilin peptidase [Streptomyces sp. NPDC052236]|uniref:prepilin peptidase n=1 Tax=Streptomyces sp. NPDC052236 TaxID=3365686 RepID=UPI0037D2817A